ncbi:hypothetical protein SEUCBS139899_002229 [Sporothrix eucalyptigena]|uniref:Uncharacterized protein n=1 Tax=Sporothrix eucalyptigena TaxID=1812306 RepID=A0ABP0B9B6_9PEZI
MSNPTRSFFFPDGWETSYAATPYLASILASIDPVQRLMDGPNIAESEISINSNNKGGTYTVPTATTMDLNVFQSLLASAYENDNGNGHYSQSSYLTYSNMTTYSWKPSKTFLKAIGKDTRIVHYLGRLKRSVPKCVYVVTAVRYVDGLQVNPGTPNAVVFNNNQPFGFRVLRVNLKLFNDKDKATVESKEDIKTGGLYDDDSSAELTEEAPVTYEAEVEDVNEATFSTGSVVAVAADGAKETWFSLA